MNIIITNEHTHPLGPRRLWHSSEKHTTKSRSLVLSDSPVLYDPYVSTRQKCHSLATDALRLLRMASMNGLRALCSSSRAAHTAAVSSCKLIKRKGRVVRNMNRSKRRKRKRNSEGIEEETDRMEEQNILE